MGRGRPPSKEPLRNAELRIFVTAEQKLAVKALARKARVAVSTYVANHLLALLDEVKTSPPK